MKCGYKIIGNNQIKFKRRNRYFFCQDCRFLTGIPAKIKFNIERSGKGYILRAPGHGELGGNYGNGVIVLLNETAENNALNNVLDGIFKKRGEEKR